MGTLQPILFSFIAFGIFILLSHPIVRDRLNFKPSSSRQLTLDYEQEDTESLSAFAEPASDPDDEQLFQRALDAASRHRSQGKKIAFLFITKGPLPLAPLWARFFRRHAERYSIYIHAAPTYNTSDADLPRIFQGRRIPSKPVKWGTLGLLNAERRLLAHALLDPANAYMGIFSEACIPLFNFSYVYDYITSSNKSFVTVSPCPKADTSWSPTLLPEVPRDHWKKGDGWKVLRRDHVVDILGDTRIFLKFYEYYACGTCHRPMRKGLIDERYIPTLLHSLKPHELANRTLTWVDWASRPNRYHPPTYHRWEVNDTLLRSMREKFVYYPFANQSMEPILCKKGTQQAPCYLFARKFGPGTLLKLLRLSKELVGS